MISGLHTPEILKKKKKMFFELLICRNKQEPLNQERNDGEKEKSLNGHDSILSLDPLWLELESTGMFFTGDNWKVMKENTDILAKCLQLGAHFDLGGGGSRAESLHALAGNMGNRVPHWSQVGNSKHSLWGGVQREPDQNQVPPPSRTDCLPLAMWPWASHLFLAILMMSA